MHNHSFLGESLTLFYFLSIFFHLKRGTFGSGSYVCMVGFSCHKWYTLFLTILQLKSWGLEASPSANLSWKLFYKIRGSSQFSSISNVVPLVLVLMCAWLAFLVTSGIHFLTLLNTVEVLGVGSFTFCYPFMRIII